MLESKAIDRLTMTCKMDMENLEKESISGQQLSCTGESEEMQGKGQGEER